MIRETLTATLPGHDEVTVSIVLLGGELHLDSVRDANGRELLPGLPLADVAHLYQLAERQQPRIEAQARVIHAEQAAELHRLFAGG